MKEINLGFRIKQLREQRNVSQEKLAESINITQSALSKIENNRTKKIEMLLMQKICDYFEVDLEYFTKILDFSNY